MCARRFSGRLIGLLAAYLVAWQAVVLPLSMPTAAFAGSLCLTEPSDPAQHPAGHDQGCPCCAGCGMQCHVPALAGAASGPLAAPHLRVAAVLVPPPLTAAPRPTVRTARMPRAPPAA